MAGRELIERIRDGEVEAFRQIVEDHGPGLRVLLGSHLDDSSRVDDLAQETFLAAYEHLDRCASDADLGRWLRGIARNKLRMYLRRRYTERDARDAWREEVVRRLDEVAAEPDYDRERIERLQQCLSELPERLRELVHARYFEGEAVKALAQRLKRSANALSVALLKSRRLLSECVERGTA